MSRKVGLNAASEEFGVDRKTIQRWYALGYIERDAAYSYKAEEIEFMIRGGNKKRKQIDWSKANCRGMNPDMFFLEDTQLERQYFDNSMLRKICFSCPIRKECMKMALESEEYGFWGGLAAYERQAIRKGRHESDRLNGLRRDLKSFGITLEQILKEVS